MLILQMFIKHLFRSNYMQRHFSTYFFYIQVILLAFLLACGSSENYIEDKGEIVAEVGNEKLYQADLQGLVPQSLTGKDSSDRVERHIQSWVQKQLLIQKAKKEINFDEAEIERKLLDYKYTLMAHEFEKRYTDEKLDKQVSEKEIKQYYEKNLANFELKENIIKAWLIQIPTDKLEKSEIKDYLQTNSTEGVEKLQEICSKFATQSTFADTTWVSFDNLVRGTPFAKIPNKVDFLKTNTSSETKENNFTFFLRIKEYKISDQTSPLNFVREEIEAIIINQRRLKLIEKLEQEIFTKAKENRSFKIYKSK